MKYNLALILLFFVFTIKAECQEINLDHVGYYADRKGKMAIDIINLDPNGQFLFTTLDPDLNTGEEFTTQGKWISQGNSVFLNPNKTPRTIEYKVLDQTNNSIETRYLTLKIIYTLKVYENEEFLGFEKHDFDSFTFYLNTDQRFDARKHPKKDTYLNIQKNGIIELDRSRQNLSEAKELILLLDNQGTTCLKIEEYNPESDYIEIEITHPIDLERTPRNREIKIKNGKAYIHNYSGTIDTSLFSMPLKKRKSR